MNENILIDVNGHEIWKEIVNNDFIFTLQDNTGYLFGKKGEFYLRVILSQVHYFSSTDEVHEEFSSRSSIIKANMGEYENNILLCEKNYVDPYYSQISLLNLETSDFYISRETKIKVPNVLKMGFKYPNTYYFKNMEYEIYYFDISKNDYILLKNGTNYNYKQIIELDLSLQISGQYKITVKSKYSSSATGTYQESIENYYYYFMIGDDKDVIE